MKPDFIQEAHTLVKSNRELMQMPTLQLIQKAIEHGYSLHVQKATKTLRELNEDLIAQRKLNITK